MQLSYLKVAICYSVAIMMMIHSRWMKFVSTVILPIFHLHDISLFYGTLPSVWSTAVLGCLYCFQRKTLTDLQKFRHILQSCFPPGFVGGPRKMPKSCLLHSESHSTVSVEQTSCVCFLYDFTSSPMIHNCVQTLLSFLSWC